MRDSGLVHGLLDITTKDELLSHMALGASWEGFVIENFLSCAPAMVQAHFLPQQRWCGNRLATDLAQRHDVGRRDPRSLGPKVERGFHAACADLSPTRKLVVYPGAESFPLGNDVLAVPLGTLCAELAV